MIKRFVIKMTSKSKCVHTKEHDRVICKASLVKIDQTQLPSETSVLLSQQLIEQIDRKISKGVDTGGNVSTINLLIQLQQVRRKGNIFPSFSSRLYNFILQSTEVLSIDYFIQPLETHCETGIIATLQMKKLRLRVVK